MQNTEDYKKQLEKIMNCYTEIMLAFPKVIIGGSLGILAHGYKLNRIPKDLDIILPFDANEAVMSKMLEKLYDNHSVNTRSTNDFEICFTHSKFEVNVDIAFNEDAQYNDLIFQNRGLRVMNLETILDFKFKYANLFGFRGVNSRSSTRAVASAQKHWDDLKFLQEQGIEFITNDKFGPRPVQYSAFKATSSSYNPFL